MVSLCCMLSVYIYNLIFEYRFECGVKSSHLNIRTDPPSPILIPLINVNFLANDNRGCFWYFGLTVVLFNIITVVCIWQRDFFQKLTILYIIQLGKRPNHVNTRCVCCCDLHLVLCVQEAVMPLHNFIMHAAGQEC